MVMKKKLIGALRKVADNPYLNLSAGMILILTAVVEIINSSEEASSEELMISTTAVNIRIMPALRLR